MSQKTIAFWAMNSTNGAFFLLLGIEIHCTRHRPLIRNCKMYNSDKSKYIPADNFVLDSTCSRPGHCFCRTNQKRFRLFASIISGSCESKDAIHRSKMYGHHFPEFIKANRTNLGPISVSVFLSNDKVRTP